MVIVKYIDRKNIVIQRIIIQKILQSENKKGVYVWWIDLCK